MKTVLTATRFLLMALTLLGHTLIFSQVRINESDKKGIEVLSKFINQNGDWTDMYLDELNFKIPSNISPDIWQQFPSIRKIETAFMAAEINNPNIGGKSFLGLLARKTAQNYESVYSTPEIVNFISIENSISFSENFIDNTKSTLKPLEKRCIYKISTYLESSCLGGMGDIITNYAGLSIDQSYEILRKSSSISSALEISLSRATIPPPTVERLRNIIKDIAIIYESVSHDETLSKYIEKKYNKGEVWKEMIEKEKFSLVDNVPNRNYEKKYKDYVDKYIIEEGTEPAKTKSKAKQPLKFDNMIRSKKGFGGIVLGNKIVYPQNLIIKSVSWISQKDSLKNKSGFLQYTILDKTTQKLYSSISPSIMEEDLFIANKILHTDQELKNNIGLGFIGVEFGNDYLVNENGNLARGKIVMHPDLINTTLGWYLILCDILPDTEDLHLKLFLNNTNLLNDIENFFQKISLSGWKLSDKPLKIYKKNNFIDVIPSFKTSKPLFQMRHYIGDSTVLFNEFEQLSEAILLSSIEYRKLNNFIRTFSLVRWITDSQIKIHNLPKKINHNFTPYCVYEQYNGDFFEKNPKKILQFPCTIEEEYKFVKGVNSLKYINDTIYNSKDSLFLNLFKRISVAKNTSKNIKEETWRWLQKISPLKEEEQKTECDKSGKLFFQNIVKSKNSDFTLLEQGKKEISENRNKIRQMDTAKQQYIYSNYFFLENNYRENSIIQSVIKEYCPN